MQYTALIENKLLAAALLQKASYALDSATAVHVQSLALLPDNTRNNSIFSVDYAAQQIPVHSIQLERTAHHSFFPSDHPRSHFDHSLWSHHDDDDGNADAVDGGTLCPSRSYDSARVRACGSIVSIACGTARCNSDFADVTGETSFRSL